MLDFKTILLENGFSDGCPTPLWKIKVTDNQFFSLKDYLVTQYNNNHHFNNCPKEAALYLAEWWKRYDGDSDVNGYKNIAFCTLGLEQNNEGVESLIDNAKRIFDPNDTDAYIKGAKLIRTTRREFVYSLFFQGGFPMERAYVNKCGVWNRLIKKFVRKNINFEDVPGAVIAKKSLKEYKNYLVSAAREHKPEGMPFACDENHRWYKLAVEGITEGDKERECHPFHAKWILKICPNEFIIRINITGPSELGENFIRSHPELQTMDSLSILLYKDEECIQTIAQYTKSNNVFISYYDINFSILYDDLSNISLRIPQIEKPILSTNIDLSIPHSFYRSINGQEYIIGARFGESPSIIIFDEAWELSEFIGQYKGPIRTSFFEKTFYLLYCDVPTDDSNVLFKIKKKDALDSYSFGSELTPKWTEIKILRKYNPLIVEDVCDLSDPTQATVHECIDDEDDGKTVKNENILYRIDRNSSWSNEIPFGKIQCVVSRNGSFSTPENKVLSVGPNLNVELIRTPPNECHYRISWDQGEIYFSDGVVSPDEDVVVRKEYYDTTFPLTCYPKSGESFVIHVKTLFKEFCLFSPSAVKVKDQEIIPWTEVNSYRYQVHDTRFINHKLGDDELSTNLMISDTPQNGSLPSEGSLGLILTADRLGCYRECAERGVPFLIGYYFFTLLKYPISLMLNSETNSVSLHLRTQHNDTSQENSNNIITSFRGHLLLINTDGEIKDDIPRGDDGVYRLPNTDERMIVVCNQRGYIRPVFIENGTMNTILSCEEYSNQLVNSSLGDKCWHAAAKFLDHGLRYDLPLQELPWIGEVIDNPGFVLALYCWLFIKAESDPISIRDVRNKMNKLISDFHIIIDEKDLVFYLNFSKDEIIKQSYIRWKQTYGKQEDNCWNEYLLWVASQVENLMN